MSDDRFEMSSEEYQAYLDEVSRKNKYHAVRTEVDGIPFHSIAEGKRYSELTLMVRAGEIEELELQPAFPCTVNGTEVCTYIADFRYLDVGTGRRIVEDVKGVRTGEYRIKKKLVEALYDIEIVEIVEIDA